VPSLTCTKATTAPPPLSITTCPQRSERADSPLKPPQPAQAGSPQTTEAGWERSPRAERQKTAQGREGCWLQWTRGQEPGRWAPVSASQHSHKAWHRAWHKYRYRLRQAQGLGEGWVGSCPALGTVCPDSNARISELSEGFILKGMPHSYPGSIYSRETHNDTDNGNGSAAVFVARETAGQGSEKGCSPLGPPVARPASSSGSTCTAAHRKVWEEDTAGSALGLVHPLPAHLTPQGAYRSGARPGMGDELEARSPEATISFHGASICPGAPVKHCQSASVSTLSPSFMKRLDFE